MTMANILQPSPVMASSQSTSATRPQGSQKMSPVSSGSTAAAAQAAAPSSAARTASFLNLLSVKTSTP